MPFYRKHVATRKILCGMISKLTHANMLHYVPSSIVTIMWSQYSM